MTKQRKANRPVRPERGAPEPRAPRPITAQDPSQLLELPSSITVGALAQLLRVNPADIINPSPSRALVFLDESTKTLEDGYFAIQVDNKVWQNDPSDRHNKGANLSFADGHSEIYKWVEKDTGHHDYNAPALKPIDRDFERIKVTIAIPPN